MEVTDISRLATYLRNNGDQILNSATKLTLTAPLLQKLNESFPLIVESNDHNGPSVFQVINTNNSKFEIFHDLAFLHDFIQKTLYLKLTNEDAAVPMALHTNVIDISKFGLLQTLELNRVPVVMVSGIQCVRHQLETLICNRCLGKLEEVLKHCGSDRSSGLVWNELHKAVFSYNALESLDHSIDYIPFVQVLDLSHNRLTNVDPIIFLPNLKCLKLSYNLLQAVPSFSKSASQKLHLLVLKCNHIEDLSGLSLLENLQYLDLSCNCLMDHGSALRPLLQLHALSWLSLDGNPLSFHKRHRVLTAQCLHHSAGNEKFVLDLQSLSKSERLVVGTLSPVVDFSHLSAANSSRLGTTASNPSDLSHSLNSQRRPGKVREAFIAENSQVGQEELYTSIVSTSLETSAEHLETKKQIEILRQRFGEENWLHSHGGSFVQDIMGLPSPLALLASSPSRAEVTTSPPPSLPIERRESEPSQEMVTSSDSIFCSKEQSSTPIETESDDSMDVEDEVEGKVYSVRRVTSTNEPGEELFLVITQFHIKEREVNYGRVRDSWTTESLSSCSKLSNEPTMVELMFETLRRDRQQRRYIMEPDEAQGLLSSIGALLESRPLSAMHQKVFRCLQCSTEFSLELSPWSSSRPRHSCPSCSSCLVIETDEHVEIARSPSQSSIGSAMSLSRSPVRRSDSDIEVISNPSQSSIEVLDDTGNQLPVPTAITESSSSGSMADSVCTSYEQRPTAKVEVVDSGNGCSVKDSESSTETLEEKTAPAANFTSVIEGLLQTVSSKLARSPAKISEPPAIIGSGRQVQYSYEDYAQVDHRLKLHLYLRVFTNELEQLTMLVRSIVVHQTSCIQCCVVISTHRVYILQVTGPEGDDPDHWLRQFAVAPLTCLQVVYTLPWCLGVGLSFEKGPDGSTLADVLLLLQDKHRTERLHSFLEGIELPGKYNTTCVPAPAVTKLLQTVVLEEPDEPCTHLSIFTSCSVANQTVIEKTTPGALLITKTNLILTQGTLLWLCADSMAQVEIMQNQKMSNLLEVETSIGHLTLHFLDETVTESDETWIIHVESDFELNDVIASIQEPWEDLFGIPLQITRKP